MVVGLDGRVWKVRRRWKLRLRWRHLEGFALDNPSALDPLDALFAIEGVDSLGGFFLVVAIGIVLVAALAIIVTFLLPLVLLVLEAVVLAVWVVVLGRSWTVEAVTEGPPPEALRIDARGWRGSRRAVETTAEALERGELPR
ncbi:MAG TPA: hypothetical protein VE596_06215 [Gaiellaceae bacterium]|nr:hypothetical protein [Gaiellaceae bacterium]